MSERITKPYIRINGKLTEASFEEAFQHICQKLQKPEVNSTLAMSSGSYSNETLYLLQRLARTVLNTNALDAFDYYRRGTDFFADKNDILPFAEMFSSDKFYCMFPDVETSETLKAVFEILKHCPDTPRYWFNTPDTLNITDYYAFFRSVNFYLIHHHLEKGIYVEALGKNYGPYKQALMADDYEALLRKNDLQDSDIKLFVEDLLTVPAPAFIVWERWLTEKAYHELENLCMLLDVQSKPAAGFITIKSELNSQGLFDMGMFPHIAPGGHTMDDSMRQKMEAVLGTAVCATPVDVADTLDCGGFRNVLIWNALNVELPKDVVNQLDKAEFSVLHSAYMPDNADLYSVILPANLPEELSGTYTDTAKVPHDFVSDVNNPLEYNNLQQLAELAERFGHTFPNNKDEIFLEYISFMEAGCHSAERHFFR
ncbi:MAG: molybdopterin-dependent oxidoreductase [Bacteroidales bacterium]|nr:molybdopterin-dependent oxidoreductase [Bacteroidales bacterium]